MNLHGSFFFFWGRTQEALESSELDPASETVAHLTIGKVRNRSFLYTFNYDHRSFTKTGSGHVHTENSKTRVQLERCTAWLSATLRCANKRFCACFS